MKKTIRLILSLIIVFLPMHSYAYKATRSERESDKPLVTTIKLDEISFYPTHDIPGEVIAILDSKIASNISGKVEKINYDVGNVITTEEILATIECADYEARLKQSSAALKETNIQTELAKWQLTRGQKLIKQQGISQEELKKLQVNYSSLKTTTDKLQAETDNAQLNVDRCAINSPFNGIITNKYINVGEYVSIGTPLFKVLNTKDLEVEARLTEQELRSILKSNSVEFNSQNTPFKIVVRSVIPQQDPTTKMQVARFTFTDARPVAGASGRVSWRDDKPHIPVEYIQHIKDDYGVFILEEGMDKDAKTKFHKLPNAIEGQAAVIDLPPGTLIVDKGRESLSDNKEVILFSNE